MGYAGTEEEKEDRGLNRFESQTLLIVIKARQNAANCGHSSMFSNYEYQHGTLYTLK